LAYAYELAAIIHDGITRMYCHGEQWIYYLTVMNETYKQPPLPKDPIVKEGILKGMYRLRSSDLKASKAKKRAHLLGSGAILREAIRAQEVLEEKYGVAADVWSVTSYKELYRDAVEVERKHLFDPAVKEKPWIETILEQEQGVFVAASDYMKVMPGVVARWIPGRLHMLGTDGFGRSDSRERLRDFFEVDWRYITLSALHELARDGALEMRVAKQALKDLEINPGKLNPHVD
jgi:pyruvate dehydrogenase E1 component